MKKIVFAFGRMNPPTVGHKKLADKINAVARRERADARIYLSHTNNPKKDPLTYEQKIKFAKQAFGNMVTKSNAKTLINVMKELQNDGYTDVIMVAGSDRVSEFDRLLSKYNGKDFTFNSIDVQSAGERDPDAEGVTGMSASKMRLAVSNGDLASFKKGTPKGIDPEEMFNAVRSGMGLNEEKQEDDMEFSDDDLDRDFFALDTDDDGDFDELDPDDDDLAALDLLIPDDDITDEDEEEGKQLDERKPLTIQQRLAMGRRMKRLAPRLARFRKLKAKRVAPPDRLAYRARKAAIKILRKKVAGKRGENYQELNPSQKSSVDQLIAKKTGVIAKLAKRLLPKIKKAELERARKARTASEDFDMNEMFEIEMVEAKNDDKEGKKKVSQDPDVKDLPGTQPKKYYKGLSDKEKERRAKQFARQAKKDPDDPSAYKAPPSNKDAKTKPSKYTLKYKQMYGEAVGVRGDDDRQADKNMIVQLRKSVDLKGNHPIEFTNGKRAKIKAGDAAKVLSMYNKIVKPSDKLKFVSHISGSEENLKQVLSASYGSYLYDIPPIKTSYLSQSVNEQFDALSEGVNEQFEIQMMLEDAFNELIEHIELQEAKGKKQNIKSYSLFYLDPTRSPLSHAIPSDNYQLEQDDTLLTPKINALLRMGLAKQGDLEKYRRALKQGEKGLTNPVLRQALLDILDKLINIVNDDTTAFQRVRNAVLKGRTDTGPMEEEVQLDEKQIKGLKKKSEKSGIPYGILKKVYDRGMAAWRTGHRPGATQQQWAFARVNSFLTGGKTRTTADKDLWAKAREAKKSKKESIEEKDPCWDGYKQVGMKTGKDGKPVPNCVREETLEEMPRWLLEPLSKVTRRKGYEAAKKVLQDVLTRKKKEAGRKGLQHTIEYYAQQIAKQFDGVDARVLADMISEEYGAGEEGTSKLANKYRQDTPGQDPEDFNIDEMMDDEEINDSYPRAPSRIVNSIHESFVMDKGAGMGQIKFASDFGIKAQFGFQHHPDTIKEMEDDACCDDCAEELVIEEAEYQGRKVKLNDPFRTPDGPKKFSVYVKNDKGNVVKVNFGSPDMEIKRDDPKRRKSFRARHNCDEKKDKTTAGYWSCRMWEKGKTVSELD